MRSYFSIFKLKFISELQYRSAAIAGVFTQIFFGLVFIMVYLAFYQSSSVVQAMTIEEVVTFIWLQQAFFALIYLPHKDKEIINMIKTGDVSYELCRPQNIYFKWYSKIYATKLSNTLLRFIPALLIAFIMPKPLNISNPESITALIIFIIAIILSSFLVTALITLYHVLVFYTLEADGVLNMFINISEILSGAIIPLPFFPTFLRKIALNLPFHYTTDLPFRLYTGNIPHIEAYPLLIKELVWITIIILLGYLLTKNALKKVVVQGG